MLLADLDRLIAKTAKPVVWLRLGTATAPLRTWRQGRARKRTARYIAKGGVRK